MTIRTLLPWIVLSVAMLPSAAAPPREPGPVQSWELEGMRPGQTFSELDSRFELRHQVPFLFPPDRRYILEATRPLPGDVGNELKGRAIDRLELVFRADKLRSVRVGYAGRAEVLFEDMAGELEEEFGAPAEVIQRGPMSVGRAHGIRLYLWLSIWTWELADATLTVEGKHYGVDRVKELPNRHEYVFTLVARSGS